MISEQIYAVYIIATVLETQSGYRLTDYLQIGSDLSEDIGNTFTGNQIPVLEIANLIEYANRCLTGKTSYNDTSVRFPVCLTL